MGEEEPENDGENESESRNKVADGGSKSRRTVIDSRVSHYLRTRTANKLPIRFNFSKKSKIN